MKYVIKVVGILIGTMLMGLGVAFYKLSSLGQDSLSGMVMSIQYLINNEKINYTICYIAINLIFFILMLCILRDKIHIGTIINLLLTGTFCDCFMLLFKVCHMLNPNIYLKIVYSILGLVIISFGIALYGEANLGIAPYDSLPLILCRCFPKVRYPYARIMIDLCCTIVACIIGVGILKRRDIVHVNTILTFIAMGPLISIFSKIINQNIYHNETITFD